MSAAVVLVLALSCASAASIHVAQGTTTNAPSTDLLTTRAAWQAGIAPYIVFSAWEEFEGFGAGTHHTSLQTAVGLFTADGHGSTGSGTGETEISILDEETSNFNGRFNYTNSGSNWLDSNDITRLRLSFASFPPVNYLSFYMTDVNDTDGGLKLRLRSGGMIQVPILPRSGGNQSGVSYFFSYAGAPLTSIEWFNNSRNDGYGIDSVFVGSAHPAVPEPGTYALLGGGLLAMGFWRSRRKA